MLPSEVDTTNMKVPASQPTAEFLARLREQIGRLENSRRPADSPSLSTGCDALDRLLPSSGLRRGSIVEWLAGRPGTAGATTQGAAGSGTETLALLVARQACREGGAWVVLDPAREFYPPAAVRLGLPRETMIVVQASNRADHLWALDQSLRCPGVAVVLAWPEKLDDRTFRRLQLAVEQGGGLGFFLRPEGVRHEPSWAEVRLLVQPLPGATAMRRLKVEVLRSRSGASGGSVEVEIDDETRTVHLAAPLAAPTDHRRAAGA